MIDVYLILAGFGIGLTLAAPGGPVNILCIQRTLKHGFWAGLAVGLGAVIGDGLLALIAASGLTFVTSFLETFASEIQLIGGFILILFGLKLSHDRLAQSDPETLIAELAPRPYPQEELLRSHVHIIPQSFLLTVANPGAMLGAFALFGGLASIVGTMPEKHQIVLVVMAVIAGNLTWWVALCHTVTRFRHRVKTDRLRKVNRYAGLALMGFGILLVMRGGFTLDLNRVSKTAYDVIAASGAV